MREALCEARDGENLVLEGVKAKAVAGRMLDMTIEQRFKNPEPTNVEVIYTFPLPWHAVLLRLEVGSMAKHSLGRSRPRCRRVPITKKRSPRATPASS